VAGVFLVAFLLLGGGAAVLAGESVPTLGGILAVLCGAALGWVGVLHLRGPVKR